MKGFTLIFLLFSLLSYPVFAQSFEIGLSAGETGYYGDLNESDLMPEKIQAAFSGFAQYNFSDRVSLRAGYLQGSLAGTDANNLNPELMGRNLHFRSPLQEVYLVGQFSIFRFSEQSNNILTPYISLGIAGFHFNPQAEYQGVWHDLQPLSTEGQGTSTFPDRQPYSLYQLAIPFGGGLKAHLSKNWIIAVDAVWRKTFTDYIDDVSISYGDPEVLRQEKGELAAFLSNRSGGDVSANTQRGTAWLKDMYQFFGISLSYRFSSGNSSSANLFCPVKF